MNSKFWNRTCAILIMLGVTGCASGIKKADIPATADPASEISSLESAIQEGYDNHLDLFAKKDMSKAKKHLREARRDLERGSQSEETLEEVAFGRAYLNRAKNKADQSTAADSGVIKARAAALAAGASKNSRLKKVMNEIDDDLRSDTKKFEKTLAPEKLSRYQRAYLDVELEAIRSEHLKEVRSRIRSAAEDKADKKAPRSYRKAVLDLKEAENEILADRRTPANFEGAVQKANVSSQTLAAVMKTMKEAKGEISENVALQLVQQNREIAGLEENLDSTEGELEKTQGELQGVSQSLGAQSAALAESQKRIQLQNALDRAQEKFSSNEAEVYQQGDKLLIRLKNMKYPSGRADLTPEAQDLLTKVKDVAVDLNPTQIVVEGHTDSVGSAKVNEIVSNKRAETVAKFFEDDPALKAQVEAIGYGYERPIAPNKTSKGRAMNRRVDIILEPGSMTIE